MPPYERESEGQGVGDVTRGFFPCLVMKSCLILMVRSGDGS
jgi:hypothetical protein